MRLHSAAIIIGLQALLIFQLKACCGFDAINMGLVSESGGQMYHQ